MRVVARPSAAEPSRSDEPCRAAPTAATGLSRGMAAEQLLSLQRLVGNRAVGQLLHAQPAIARRPFIGAPEDFNPESIVNDLRRAIDQSDYKAVPKKAPSGAGTWTPTLQQFDVVRPVKFGDVVRALDGLTTEQVTRVKDLYSQLETKGERTLDDDLFGLGASNLPSELNEEQRDRLKALLRGTRASTPDGVKPDARLEADAMEIHDLLSGSWNVEKRERVMALHRRPRDEIDRIYAYYEERYEKPLAEVFHPKLEGLQARRAAQLRLGNLARADAYAIEDKRLQIEKLEQETLDFDLEDPTGEKRKKKRREQLTADIEGIVEVNRQEALRDAPIGATASEAVQQRLQAVLGQAVDSDKSVGDQLAGTLKDVKGGAIQALLRGDLVEASARRLIDLETSKGTNTEKIAPLLRGLRDQAQHDMLAAMRDTRLAASYREAIAADFQGAWDRQAKAYTREFAETYDRLRGNLRSYDEIVASASDANEALLTALMEGGGTVTDPLVELDYAIAKGDKGLIKSVLRAQPTGKEMKDLAQRYEERHEVSLEKRLFGMYGHEGAESDSLRNISALLKARDAAHAWESLQKPEAMGGLDEAKWIALHGKREMEVTEANSGLTGLAAQAWDDPETQDLMNESVWQLEALQKRYEQAAVEDQPAILAEMRRRRATLTRDADAYEEDMERLRAELRSAVSLAFQVALTIAMPAMATSFIATTAISVGATVASNMVIYGEAYGLKQFRNDVLGGLGGALAGKLGDEVIDAVIIARAATPAAAAAARVGFKTALAKEATNLVMSTAGTTLATGENGFTVEGLAQSVGMIPLGKIVKPRQPATVRPGHPPPPTGTDAPAPTPGEATPLPGAPDAPAARPEAPIVDPAAPAREDPLDPAGAEAGQPTRKGNASERLEARAAVNATEQLAARWPGLPLDARRAELTAIANRVLAARGVPNVEVVTGSATAGSGGQFDFKNWKVIVDPATLQQPNLPPELVSYVSDFSRHEIDHALQFWSMARMLASQPGVDAARIHGDMGVPPEIAQHAIDITTRDGPMSAAEQAAAGVWWNVYYGSGGAVRNYNLDQRRATHEQLAALEAQIKAAGANADPALIQQRDALRTLAMGFDAIYKSSPEEARAYEAGGIVAAEARLIEAERQADLADWAVEQVAEWRKDVEERLFAGLAAEEGIDPRLQAEFDTATAREKRLQEKADALRAQRDVIAAEVGGGPGATAADSGTATAPGPLTPKTVDPTAAAGPAAPVPRALRTVERIRGDERLAATVENDKDLKARLEEIETQGRELQADPKKSGRYNLGVDAARLAEDIAAQHMDDRVAGVERVLRGTRAKDREALLAVAGDPEAVRRIAEKGDNVNAVKGQLFEELTANQVRGMLGTKRGRKAIAGDRAGEQLEFVPGHEIRELRTLHFNVNGKQVPRDLLLQFSDGLVVVKTSAAQWEVIAIVEAKSGHYSASQLGTKASRGANADENLMIAIDVWRAEHLGPDEMLLPGDLRADEILAEHGDEIRAMADQIAEAGQGQLDLERRAEMDFVRVDADGRPTGAVRLRADQEELKVVGFVPSDVNAGKLEQAAGDDGRLDVRHGEQSADRLQTLAERIVAAFRGRRNVP